MVYDTETGSSVYYMMLHDVLYCYLSRSHSKKKNTRHHAVKYELYFICCCLVNSLERRFSYGAHRNLLLALRESVASSSSLRNISAIAWLLVKVFWVCFSAGAKADTHRV